MSRKTLSALSLAAAMIFASQANADSANFSLSGAGISGQGTITYTVNPGGADDVTGITGTFSDSNVGITNVGILQPVPINPVVPLPSGVTAPDFSYFPVANGVPNQSPPSPSLSYDDNFYPAGSPSVCTDYPFFGGTLDVYGLMFNLANGESVCVWSNGNNPTAPGYGVAVADSTNTYDYVNDSVNFVAPEPSTLALTALGALSLFHRNRKA